MQNYLVKLLFNIHIDDRNDCSKFDEQIRIIESNSAEEAFFKARSIGQNEEESFLSANNEIITWHFVDVLDVYDLSNMADGQLLYSCSKKDDDHQSYIKFIKQKALELQIKNLSLV